MSYHSRIPGNIALQTTGHNSPAEKGWRQFFLSDSRCVLQNDTGVTVSSNAAAPCSINESTGNTVITFLTGHDGGTAFPIDGYVAGMPLRTDEGNIITFGTPFVLKTMIEVISMTGDHSDQSGEHMTQPTISMGISMNSSDFDADDNRHMGSGFRFMSRSSASEAAEEDIKWTVDSLQTDGSGKITSAGNAYSGSDNSKLHIAELHVGPDMATASSNAFLIHNEFQASGDGFNVPSAGIDCDGFNANQGFNDAATTVTLYVAIQDMETDSFSGNTACVLTVRFWYMVEADFHNLWGGSGSA